MKAYNSLIIFNKQILFNQLSVTRNATVRSIQAAMEISTARALTNRHTKARIAIKIESINLQAAKTTKALHRETRTKIRVPVAIQPQKIRTRKSIIPVALVQSIKARTKIEIAKRIINLVAPRTKIVINTRVALIPAQNTKVAVVQAQNTKVKIKIAISIRAHHPQIRTKVHYLHLSLNLLITTIT
jgi:hypothetical protein